MTLNSYKKKVSTLVKSSLFISWTLLIILGNVIGTRLSRVHHSPIANQIFAQEGGVADGEDLGTNPKIRTSAVTATVPDITPPSAPFLISPENGALLNTGRPTFVWQESTDDVGVTYYQMYLDGALLFDNIPIVTTSSTDYELTYDSVSGQYSLTPTNIINDNTHTWSISAYDLAENNNTSATWSFTIDTLAPSFVIESIGPTPTDISAQDINSVPVDPIELEDNSPIFIGTGEASASAQVTVTIPDESSQVINFTINEDGNWNFQLGILPRDKIITLNFVITDLAGNISVLTDLKILIIQNYIIIPPEATPEITPGASVPPSSGPISPSASPTPSPIIKIAILPPNEILVNLIKNIFPDSVTNKIVKTPNIIQATISNAILNMAPIGVILVTAIIPIFSFLTLLLQFGQQFSWQLILKILQAIGLIPPAEPAGIVYDSSTNKPVAFALLTITSVSLTNKKGAQKIIETVVTDVNGVYQGIQLPEGKYSIRVSHQDYRFPTSKKRPNYLTIREFYRGEVFNVTSSNIQQLFLIPVDKTIKTNEKYSLKQRIRRAVQNFRLINFFWPLFIISIIITIFYPTIINWLVLSFYIFILLIKMIKSLKKPSISGYVHTTSQSPIENAIIRISDPIKGELVSITTTDSAGYFYIFIKPSVYQIQISKNGFIWMREGSQLSFEEIDVTKSKVSLNIEMKDASEIYEEMFG